MKQGEARYNARFERLHLPFLHHQDARLELPFRRQKLVHFLIRRSCVCRLALKIPVLKSGLMEGQTFSVQDDPGIVAALGIPQFLSSDRDIRVRHRSSALPILSFDGTDLFSPLF